MRRPEIRTCGTFLATLAAVCAAQASRGCGETDCGEQRRCCAPGTGSGNGIGNDNGSAAAEGCCRLPGSTFLDNVGWLTRKLSGILILLLLFAVGYFIQRIVCPRPRRRHRGEHGPDEPSSLFPGRAATASQDSLLDRFQDCGFGDFTSPVLQLPAYDEVKYLPTYEETMQQQQEQDQEEQERGVAPGPGEVLRGGLQERRDAVRGSRSSRNSV